MMRFFIKVRRFIFNFRRPSKKNNTRQLRERGELIDSLVFREARETDIPALAALHVKTWSDTYWTVKNPPAYATREWQWRKAFFEENDGSWFCIVIENPKDELIGFAKGRLNDNPEYPGELNKLYLLREYQRLGLGRKLVGYVTRRFLSHGIQTMSCYVDPGNPSCSFFEALGGEWLREPDGKVNYSWYVWRDLNLLESICPAG